MAGAAVDHLHVHGGADGAGLLAGRKAGEKHCSQQRLTEEGRGTDCMHDRTPEKALTDS